MHYIIILYCINFQGCAYIWMINLQLTPTNAIILLMDVQMNGTTAKLDLNVTITINQMEICKSAKIKYMYW